MAKVPTRNFRPLNIDSDNSQKLAIWWVDNSTPGSPNIQSSFLDYETINFNEFWESLSYPGLRRFIIKYPGITAGEVFRSLFKPIFVNSLKKLIPDIRSDMLTKGQAGIRAQLMNINGGLEQDFCIRRKDNIVSILNAPSPAATSSLAIAKYVVAYLNK